MNVKMIKNKVLSFNISFDPEAGAMYLKLSPNKTQKTIELENETLVDVDHNGNLVGIEFLNPCKIDLGIEQIIRVYKSPQLSFLDPGKLQKALEALAGSASSRN